MPWQLTSPLDPGDLHPGGTYNQVKIVDFRHDSRRGMILVTLECGTTSNEVWTPGIHPQVIPQSVLIQGEEYETLIASHEPQPAEKTYDAVKRGIYEFLNSKGLIPAGSVI